MSAKTAGQALAFPHESLVASAYNQAGVRYLTYADGDPRTLYAFEGQYAYGDRCTWERLFSELCTLRSTGARSIRILDLGCGPGTWIRRLVTRARAIGFDRIVARGFDIAEDQVIRARELSANLAALPGVELTFEVADICDPLPETDGSVDLCICLCAVLNHLPQARLSRVFAEVARVTAGRFFTSIRAVGSQPTVYVGAIEEARRFRQDNRRNRLEIEFQNGRRITLPSHLFAAAEIGAIAGLHLGVEDVCGLDLFHGRFAADPRRNPDSPLNGPFAVELERLERSYCRDPDFIDHATHLLLTCRSRRTHASAG